MLRMTVHDLYSELKPFRGIFDCNWNDCLFFVVPLPGDLSAEHHAHKDRVYQGLFKH